MRTTALSILVVFSVTARADEPLPAGTPVSRPLTPVVEVAKPEEAKILPAESVIEPCESDPASKGPIPDSWSRYELLLTWSKSHPLPPLVTGANGNLLIGGRGIGNSVQAGFRFGMGWVVSTDHNMGFEFEGMWLGTRVSTQRLNGGNLARPYGDAIAPFVLWVPGPVQLPVSGFGMGTGGIQVTTTTRVQGWEVSGIRNIVDAGDVVVNAIGGYKYFGANEGLHVYQQSLRPAAANAPATLWGVYDQFDARNNFHGGHVGLDWSAIRGPWRLGLRTSVAIGTNFETVEATGRSSATTAALPAPIVAPYQAGFLAVNSNAGRYLESNFAVLPEARMTLGVMIGDHCQLFAGYDFLYLSNAVRPGDQVDVTVNTLQSPIAGGQVGPPAIGMNRPEIPFRRTDFWVQGLTLGLSGRY